MRKLLVVVVIAIAGVAAMYLLLHEKQEAKQSSPAVEESSARIVVAAGQSAHSPPAATDSQPETEPPDKELVYEYGNDRPKEQEQPAIASADKDEVFKAIVMAELPLLSADIHEKGEVWIRIKPEESAKTKQIMKEVAGSYTEITAHTEPVRVMLWVGGRPHAAMTFPEEIPKN